MLNRAIITGRLTRDPELRYTNSGTAVASFRLAVDRQFKNKQTGERDADFINCVIWRKSAENFCNFTHKGSLVGLDGRLQSRTYEDQQGQRRFVTEVVVDSFALLESRKDNSQQAATQQPAAPAKQGDGWTYGPQQAATSQSAGPQPQRPAQQSKPTDPPSETGKPIDVATDDLPF